MKSSWFDPDGSFSTRRPSSTTEAGATNASEFPRFVQHECVRNDCRLHLDRFFLQNTKTVLNENIKI